MTKRVESPKKIPHIYAGFGLTKSCGLCLRHYQARGGSKDPLRGWLCQSCTDKRLARKP